MSLDNDDPKNVIQVSRGETILEMLCTSHSVGHLRLHTPLIFIPAPLYHILNLHNSLLEHAACTSPAAHIHRTQNRSESMSFVYQRRNLASEMNNGMDGMPHLGETVDLPYKKRTTGNKLKKINLTSILQNRDGMMDKH